MGGPTLIGALGYVRAVTEKLVPTVPAGGVETRGYNIYRRRPRRHQWRGLMLGLAVAGWEVPVCGYSVGPDARTYSGK